MYRQLGRGAAPMDGASPTTMLSTPSGRPARRAHSASASAVSGVASAGLSTTCRPRPRPPDTAGVPAPMLGPWCAHRVCCARWLYPVCCAAAPPAPTSAQRLPDTAGVPALALRPWCAHPDSSARAACGAAAAGSSTSSRARRGNACNQQSARPGEQRLPYVSHRLLQALSVDPPADAISFF